jgi:hypothetical protein
LLGDDVGSVAIHHESPVCWRGHPSL